jgi:nitrous oxide reductase accessory protein NosL
MRSRLAILALAVLLAGCARPAGPPAIRLGTSCAACGMEIHDLKYACERRVADRLAGGGHAGGDDKMEWRTYDAIECLLEDAGPDVDPSDTWLADYDAATLHRADSLWVVHGGFPSPMGGGYAALRDRTTADAVAHDTHGTVARLAAFVHGSRL